MKSSTLFERGPLPPYVHLASTRRHSRDRFSQAFPVFRALLLPCIILNANRRTKNGGGLGTKLHAEYVLVSYEGSATKEISYTVGRNPDIQSKNDPGYILLKYSLMNYITGFTWGCTDYV